MRMGNGISDSTMTSSTVQRWSLFIALLALGFAYIAAYLFFSVHSRNFLIVQRNQRAMVFGAAHPASLPVAWQFGKNSPDNARLGSGWLAVPAYAGVRLLTQDGWVVFMTNHPVSDVLLQIDAAVLTTVAAPRNTVEVSVNGTSLGSWERGGSDAPEPIDVRVPHALIADGQWQVRVHVDRLATMFRSDAGAARNGQDFILLGMSLHSAVGSGQPATTGSSALAR
jgi:hypothetical protein